MTTLITAAKETNTKPSRIKIHSSAQDSSGNIGNRACVEVAILKTVITVKNGSILLRRRIKKISGFSVHTIPDS